MNKVYFWIVGVFAVCIPLLFASGGFVFGDRISANGWTYDVFATDLPEVDNIVLDERGALYATLELSDGHGKVVFLKDGTVTTIIDDISRADGLKLSSGKLLVTEEIIGGRVLEFDLSRKRMTERAILRKPEGIGIKPDNTIIVSEDVAEGRVVLIHTNGDTSTLVGGLNRPEGLVLNAAGDILVAETGTGRVLKITQVDTGTPYVQTLIQNLNHPDQIAIGTDGAIWITEDKQNGRLLKFHNGVLSEIATGLNRPQGIAPAADGSIYLAEQGNNRILRFRRH